VWNSTPARPIVLGVVVDADRVRLNAGAVSAGATVYDGDRFSTAIGGMLLLRGDAATLELPEESEMIVRSGTDGAQGTETELSKGTLAFRAPRAAVLEIVARETHIRPAAEAPTIGQVSVTSPKELRIYARRGSLQFSYRGETETIAEGESCRVTLDPPQDEEGTRQARPTAEGIHIPYAGRGSSGRCGCGPYL
jgi:plasmid stabilization system protein ParE